MTMRTEREKLWIFRVFAVLAVVLLCVAAFAQETTGGLQGTVRDPKGAVVPRAHVEVTGTTLVGVKKLDTDSSGYYRFANLPPGVYTLTVKAPGFATLKREGVNIGTGRLPTLDLELKIGGTETIVEVSAQAQAIDVATNHTLTNVSEDTLAELPKGRSFQSVIQFAPSARNEPLAGAVTNGAATGGTGGTSPGNGGNGQAYGFSVGGGADSENSYLVEGQDTANIIGGYSTTNVPFEFIQEVQIKSSGIEAEHGGSLGGVINVVMQRGSNETHGEAWTYFEPSALDAGPSAYLRYDPTQSINLAARQDIPAQLYQPKKDRSFTTQPGFKLGGALVKDRLWYFASFAPEFTSISRTVNWSQQTGNQTFTRDGQSYYGIARLDAAVTSKIRVWSSWLTEYQRVTGVRPLADSTQGYFNPDTLNPITNYAHDIGYSAPNQTFNVAADITLTPTLVLTTRYGYSFQNYHDFGYPTNGALIDFEANGVGATDLAGNALPANLQQPIGNFSAAYNSTFTFKNAMKHYQFDQDVAWFKSGWWGTHNFKFGYQLNHLYNDIQQPGNLPDVQIYPGQEYAPESSVGIANCVGTYLGTQSPGSCGGLYGYITVNDFGTVGRASNYNHGLFAQDAWTVGHGLTLNLGIRVDKENLPAYPATGLPANPISFGWGDKIAPRFGAAWDVFRNGKLKVFGSYGVFNDVMKLNLAISSFGGQYWRMCNYALDTTNLSSLDAIFNPRSCPGGPTTVQANWAGGSTPAGLTFLENIDNRGTEGVVPGLKPYRQHESVFGVDYQLAKNLAFEARWDRRRLDHAIEDAAIFDAANGVETFTNVNPGEGVDRTFNGFSNFLYGSGGPTCDPSVCGMAKAVRSYDGLELRLTKNMSKNWQGMFSYTYSKLRGNYDGLTSTDEIDGFGGRNAPNNSRAFDEPYFSYTSHGTLDNGALPTDRPNTFKGFGFYRMPWGSGRQATTIGWSQYFYQGTPQSSFIDVGYAGGNQPYFPVYTEGRGKWDYITQNADGSITLNKVGTYRTPWYIQSDASLKHEFKVNKNNEHQVVSLEMNVLNLLNQHSITAYYDGINSLNTSRALAPDGLRIVNSGQYAAYMSPYNWVSVFNNNYYSTASGNISRPMVYNSQYGQPFRFQFPRTVRLKFGFTF